MRWSGSVSGVLGMESGLFCSVVKKQNKKFQYFKLPNGQERGKNGYNKISKEFNWDSSFNRDLLGDWFFLFLYSDED